MLALFQNGRMIGKAHATWADVVLEAFARGLVDPSRPATGLVPGVEIRDLVRRRG